MELKRNNYFLSQNSILIKKFIRELSKQGKVQKVEKSLLISLQNLKFKVRLNPLILFLYFLNEIKPFLTLKTLRLGSVVYHIPVPLTIRKQYFKSIKLLINTIRSSTYTGSLSDKIFKEFFSILKGTSTILKMNTILYKTASNSRSFIHYRWD